MTATLPVRCPSLSLTVTDVTLVATEVDIGASLKTESTDTAAKLQINTSLPEDNIYVALGCPTYLLAAPTPQPFDSAYRAKVSDMLAVAAPVSIRRIVSGQHNALIESRMHSS